MSPKDWIVNTFGNDGKTFYVNNGVSGNIDIFLTLFGDVLQNAITNNTSIYDALKSVPDRGWSPYFDEWKSKGIIF